jgi:hypothetical protein
MVFGITRRRNAFKGTYEGKGSSTSVTTRAKEGLEPNVSVCSLHCLRHDFLRDLLGKTMLTYLYEEFSYVRYGALSSTAGWRDEIQINEISYFFVPSVIIT